MPIYLKQSTASQEVPLGYFVDSTDGNTEETALTIANTDIKLWKSGATTLASKNSGGATHISNGVYYCVLDDTDTNTLGPMVIFCHPTGALAVRVECVVLAANIFDSLIAGTDLFQVDLTQVVGSTTNVSALATNVDAILTDTADMQPKLGTPAGASMSADIAAVKSDSAAILLDTGTDGVLLSATATSAALVDAVWDEPTVGHATAGTTGKALSDILVDTAEIGVAGAGLTEAGGTGDQFTGIASVGAVSGAVGSVTTGVTVTTNNDKTGYALSSAGVDAIFDEPTAGHVTAGTYGVAITDILADTAEIGVAGAGLTEAGGTGDQFTGIAAVGAVTGAVGSVTGNVGGSVASVTAGVTIAVGGVVAGAHAAAELNSLADAFLDRNMATGTDSGTDSTTTRTVRQALRALRNKVVNAAGTVTVYKEDDSTASWTTAISTTAGDPVSGSDPT